VVRRPGRETGPEPPLGAVLDVGTGSGAIALALLVEGVARRAIGLDRSREALAQAAENRDRAGIPPERFELRSCGPDPWEVISPGERFDAVVSNPPYVRDAEIAALAPEVREHEPRAALSGGPDGLAVVRIVVRRARERLAAGGALFLEVGADQGEAVSELLQASGEWRTVEILRDLAGRDRYVRALPH
jgi:release factor glutamine methyltransferase